MDKDRELLEKLYRFVAKGEFIAGDEISIGDMVKRYQNPPMTMRTPYAMKMTIKEYNVLTYLLKDIETRLKETNAEPAQSA